MSKIRSSKRVRMKRVLGAGLVLAFLLIAVACSPSGESTTENTPIPIADPAIYVDGVLLPIRDAVLAFPVGGHVADILVEAGEAVREGDALAILDEGDPIEADIAAVEASRVDVQVALDDLYDAAEMARTAAWQRMLDSRLAVSAAQEALDDFNVDRYEDNLEDSDSRLADAEAELETAEDDLRDYDDLDPDNPTYRRYEDAVEDAREELHEAERERAEIEVEYDQLRLNLARAEAEYERATDDYEALAAGPDPDEVQRLEARLGALDASLASLQAHLEDLTLRAPFSGMVVRIELTKGHLVMVGEPVIWMADFSSWTVETEDLTEHEVVNIQEGTDVTMVPDALPELVLGGVLHSIESIPTPHLGDVTYTATIHLTEVPEELRWGMSVVIAFEK